MTYVEYYRKLQVMLTDFVKFGSNFLVGEQVGRWIAHATAGRMDGEHLLKCVAAVVAGYEEVCNETSSITMEIISADSSSCQIVHEDDIELPRPGKGNKTYGIKATSIRQKMKENQIYINAINHFKSNIFKELCGLSAPEFDMILNMSAPFYYRAPEPKATIYLRRTTMGRKSKASTWTSCNAFPLFFNYMRVGVDGSPGVERDDFNYGLSKGTVLDYIRQVIIKPVLWMTSR